VPAVTWFFFDDASQHASAGIVAQKFKVARSCYGHPKERAITVARPRPRDVDEAQCRAKHLPKAKNRLTKISPFAAAAIRGSAPPGCRLGEAWGQPSRGCSA
jgi:hypothetical protein